MPFVNVKVIEGVFTAEKKREILRRVTEIFVSLEGEAIRPVTHVAIDEVKSGDWGIGGRSITTEDVRAMAGGGNRG